MSDNMPNATRVQVQKGESYDRAWLAVTDPTDVGPLVDRIVIDISLGDIDYMERVAAYRNKLAEVMDKKIARQWTRKSVAESFVLTGCNALREQMSMVAAEFGPLPQADDVKAMDAYVRKVAAWDKKRKG